MNEEHIVSIANFLIDFKESIIQNYNSSLYQAFLLYKEVESKLKFMEWQIFLDVSEVLASVFNAIIFEIYPLSLTSIIESFSKVERDFKIKNIDLNILKNLVSKLQNNDGSEVDKIKKSRCKSTETLEKSIPIDLDVAMSLLEIPKIKEKLAPKNRTYDSIFYDNLESFQQKNKFVLQRCSDERHYLEVLKYKNVSNLLTSEKVFWNTEKKPFLTVCNDPNHAFHISQVSFFEKTKVEKQFKDPLNSMNNITMLIDKKVYSKLNDDIRICISNKIHFIPINKNNRGKKLAKSNLNDVSYSTNNTMCQFVGQAQHPLQTKTYDFSMGDCSYLDTCYKWESCRYTHYFTLLPLAKLNNDIQECVDFNSKTDENIKNSVCNWREPLGKCLQKTLPPQWINCDVSIIDYAVLGKFSAIIADPAWNIHMDKTKIPTNSNANDEMLLTLDIHKLQDEGIIFLWVTGRAIEQGKKCLTAWGYKYVNEIVWIKTNQLNRTITTGMTGHWLNHSKEHLLVGIKGNPKWINKSVDVDLIVATAREASRKPDQLYGMIERLVGKSSRKLEIFGRQHNTRPGWFTIGNQLDGVNIHEKEVEIKFSKFQSTQNC